jgi:hypothetical protein
MSFTILFAIFALVVLIVVFGVAYKIKGWKAALIVTSIAFIVIATLFTGLIYVIVNSMPN